MLNLRPYQKESIAAYKEHADAGPTRQMIVLPTGCGKTITGLALARELGARTLWVAHRDELITQPYKAVKSVWPEAKRGIVKAELNQWRRDIVFASVQTIARPRRLEQLKQAGFDLVVIDEAHHAPAESYRKVIDGLQPRLLLGLTATPERADNARMDDVFDGICHHYHLRQAVEDGYLSGVELVQRPINVNLDAVGSRAGDFKAGDLDIALMQAGIVEEVVAAYKEHAAGRKVIIFTISVAQSEAIAQRLSAEGFPASSVSGDLHVDIRRKRLTDFAEGRLEAIANCFVLTEGFDEPAVDCIIMARPTQSKSLYIQCVGRGLRLYPGKDSCRIIDMVGLSNRHTLVQAPVIFGTALDAGEKSESSDPDPDRVRDFWRSRLSTQMEGLESVSRSTMHWLRGENGSFILNIGQYGTVTLVGRDDQWRVGVVGSRVDKRSNFPLADGWIPLELAQGIAEDYVRRCKSVNLASGGRWRDEPASEGQLAALARWKIKVPGTLTRGEASDILTAKAAAKSSEMATAKQIAFLQRRGIDVPPKLTKQEAGRLIARARSTGP